eukprot:SAG11_NODE_1950_length_4013_cov_4.004854_3_plen_78_part_00
MRLLDVCLTPIRPTLSTFELFGRTHAMQVALGSGRCSTMPLDDACLLRFLRARKLDVKKAAAQLRETLVPLPLLPSK